MCYCKFRSVAIAVIYHWFYYRWNILYNLDCNMNASRYVSVNETKQITNKSNQNKVNELIFYIVSF